MKSIRRIFLTFLVLVSIGILFRGWFYRHLVVYKSVGLRENYFARDKKLLDCLDARSTELKDPNISQIIKLGLSITSEELNYSMYRSDIDPNKLVHSKTAHCVGYASFFASTCNYLLKKNNLAATWTAKPHVGHLYVFGSNIHQYFNSSFFKDHDFVTIENKITGELFAVDPTVNDYLCIDFISYSK
jgi:hypothetical protein